MPKEKMNLMYTMDVHYAAVELSLLLDENRSWMRFTMAIQEFHG